MPWLAIWAKLTHSKLTRAKVFECSPEFFIENQLLKLLIKNKTFKHIINVLTKKENFANI
jgi:hypothetical protein